METLPPPHFIHPSCCCSYYQEAVAKEDQEDMFYSISSLFSGFVFKPEVLLFPPYYLPPPLLSFSSLCILISLTGVISTLGGPECLLFPAGDGENESRFFAEPADPLSGVPFFSNPNGLGNRDLAFVDCVGAM